MAQISFHAWTHSKSANDQSKIIFQSPNSNLIIRKTEKKWNAAEVGLGGGNVSCWRMHCCKREGDMIPPHQTTRVKSLIKQIVRGRQIRLGIEDINGLIWLCHLGEKTEFAHPIPLKKYRPKFSSTRVNGKFTKIIIKFFNFFNLAPKLFPIITNQITNFLEQIVLITLNKCHSCNLLTLSTLSTNHQALLLSTNYQIISNKHDITEDIIINWELRSFLKLVYVLAQYEHFM